VHLAPPPTPQSPTAITTTATATATANTASLYDVHLNSRFDQIHWRCKKCCDCPSHEPAQESVKPPERGRHRGCPISLLKVFVQAPLQTLNHPPVNAAERDVSHQRGPEPSVQRSKPVRFVDSPHCLVARTRSLQRPGKLREQRITRAKMVE